MSQYQSLTVSAVQKLTTDTVAISFAPPHNGDFSYLSGQYLTLKVNINGEDVVRSYSLCSSMHIEKDLTVAVKRVENGLMSNYLNDNVNAGDVIEVMPPLGNFILEPNLTAANHYILFAGGSGITPMYSIIKTVLKAEPTSQITLVYANRDVNNIIFKEELANITNPNFKLVHVLSQSELKGAYKGRLTQQLALQILREQTNLNFTNAVFYTCGPEGMMDAAYGALDAFGIPETARNREYFTEKSEENKESAAVGDTLVEDFSFPTSVKIIFDDEEHTIEVEDDSKSVLELALDKDIDPPYSCLVAACCTCRAKVKSGNVMMKDRESLTDDEIAEGYVLTCQSIPTSHGVVLNFDE